jgi:hypothetical protein
MPMLVTIFLVPNPKMPEKPPRNDSEMLAMLQAMRGSQEAKAIGILDVPVLPLPGDTISVIGAGEDGEAKEYRVIERIFGVEKPTIILPDEHDTKYSLHDISVVVTE